MKREELKHDRPEPLWFFERGDGLRFAAKADEAWDLLRNTSNWQRRDFKLVGYSEGNAYFSHVKQEMSKHADFKKEVEEMERNLERYRKTEEKLIFDDLLEDDDPKVKKARARIAELDGVLEGKQEKLNKYISQVNQEAFEKEWKIASHCKEIPSPENNDIKTPGASPRERQKIINKMA